MADASTINIAMSFPVYSGQIHARKRYLAESPCATHSLLTTLWLLYCPDAIRVSTHIIAFSMQLMWINRLGWHFPISRIPRPNKYSNMHIRDVGGIAQRLGSDAQGGGLNSLGEFLQQSRMPLLCPTCPTNKDSSIKRFQQIHPSIDCFRAPSPVPFSPLTRKAARRKMSLLATPFAFLFFFFGFALAQIVSPNCELRWAWVCILSFPQYVLWPSPDLMVLSRSHSIL